MPLTTNAPPTPKTAHGRLGPRAGVRRLSKAPPGLGRRIGSNQGRGNPGGESEYGGSGPDKSCRSNACRVLRLARPTRLPSLSTSRAMPFVSAVARRLDSRVGGGQFACASPSLESLILVQYSGSWRLVGGVQIAHLASDNVMGGFPGDVTSEMLAFGGFHGTAQGRNCFDSQ